MSETWCLLVPPLLGGGGWQAHLVFLGLRYTSITPAGSLLAGQDPSLPPRLAAPHLSRPQGGTLWGEEALCSQGLQVLSVQL